MGIAIGCVNGFEIEMQEADRLDMQGQGEQANGIPVRRVSGSYGEPRSRRKSFSQLLRDRDQSEEKVNNLETLRRDQNKEGFREFMGSV